MTVKELITQLEDYSPNAKISINSMNTIYPGDECSMHVDGDCDKTLYFNIESISHTAQMPD